jgi:hypothetical protein
MVIESFIFLKLTFELALLPLALKEVINSGVVDSNLFDAWYDCAYFRIGKPDDKKKLRQQVFS